MKDFRDTKYLYNILELFLFLIDSIIFFIFLIFLINIIFIIGACRIFRFFVWILSRILRKDEFGNFPESSGHFFLSLESDFLNPSKCIIVQAEVDGCPDIESAKENLSKKLTETRNPDGTLVYRNMQEGIENWLGYFFYSTKVPFNIDRHIKILDANLTKVNLSDLISKEIRKPFPKCSALWSVTIVLNYNNENKTLYLFRLHHSVGDGFSIFKLFQSDLICENGPSSIKVLKPKNTEIVKKSAPLSQRIKSFLVSLKKLIEGPRKMFLKQTPPQLDLFNKTASNFDKEKQYFSNTEKFKQSLLQNENFSLISYINSAVCHSLNEHFNMGQFDAKENYEESLLPILLIMPRSNHPDDKMTNHYRVARCSLPLSLTNNLENCQNIFDELRQSCAKSRLINARHLMLLIGQFLPANLFRWVLGTSSFKSPGVIVTNMPGPQEEVRLWENSVNDLQFFTSTTQSPWLIVHVLSYKGYLRIMFSGLSTAFPTQNALDGFRATFEIKLNNLLNSV